LLNIKERRYWNFKENFTGKEPELDMTDVIWIKWGNPCTGEFDLIHPEEESKILNSQNPAVTIKTDDICEVLSNFGDLNVVKDSLVSWYANFREIDFDSFTGDFNKMDMFYHKDILSQIEEYLQKEFSTVKNFENLKFKVTHYDEAEKFNGTKIYK
jgi:hypothetical protein